MPNVSPGGMPSESSSLPDGAMSSGRTEPIPVDVNSTRAQTWLTIRHKETQAQIAPNREVTLGVDRISGADVCFSAPDGIQAVVGIYLVLRTDDCGGVEIKLASADRKGAIETPDGITPLTFSDKKDDGWFKFAPKTDKVAFGGLQFFSLGQEERHCVELTVTVGDQARTLDIGEEIFIGREEENGQGQLLSETVSRRHARIAQTVEGLFIEDRGSMNGTFIARQGEREPIKVKATPSLLKPGDRVWFGSVKGTESAYMDVVPVRLTSHGKSRTDVLVKAPAGSPRPGRDTLEDDEIGKGKGDPVLDAARNDSQ